MQDLNGRVVVVTGAASGVGLGIAQAFAQAGGRLVLADRDEARLAEAVRSLGPGADCLGVPTDVTSATSVDALAQEARAAFGEIHVLCNNAGVACAGLVWEQSSADWDWMLDVNVKGVVHGLRSFVPMLLEQACESHVVNTASMVGLHAAPLSAAYVTSKHAVLAISECLRLDLEAVGSRIGVSVLCPGPVRTRVRDQPGRPARTVEPEHPALMEHDALMRDVIATGLDPLEVGRCVVRGVRASHFYLLPQPELLVGIRARLDGLEADTGLQIRADAS